MKILNYTLRFAAAVSIATAVECSAADTVVGANAGVSVIGGASSRDLPAKAAALVAQADPVRQPSVTSEAVKAVLRVNPGAATLVVGSIAREVPAMAANAALAAASVNPYQVTAIARAAASAAPQKAGEIVKVLCRALPYSYRAIAETVSSVVPGATREILNAVVAAIPNLKATIAQVEAENQGSYLSVYSVLAQVGDGMAAPVNSQSSGSRAFTSTTTPNAPPVIPTIIIPSAGAPVPAGGQTDAKL